MYIYYQGVFLTLFKWYRQYQIAQSITQRGKSIVVIQISQHLFLRRADGGYHLGNINVDKLTLLGHHFN